MEVRKVKSYLVILAVLALLLVGCGSPAVSDGSYSLTNEDGSVTTIDYDLGNSDSWCAKGAEWSSSHAALDDSSVDATWMVEGFATGDYEGLCHVVYTVESVEGEITMDYYFNEDETQGYVEIVGPDGKVYSQEISA
jgi:hypothetical protein